MKKILILYYSISGSTRRISEIIYKELLKKHHADLYDLNAVNDMGVYDVIIIAGPMRFGGFIKKINRFIKKHEHILGKSRVIFVQTCLYILQGAEDRQADIPVYVDRSLNMQTKSVNDMDTMDKTHRLSYYIDRLMKISSEVKPEMVAFFNGTLDLTKLGLLERLFMKFITLVTTREKVGDFVNPASVLEWAGDLSARINTR